MKTSLEARRGRRRIAMTLIALAAPLIALFGFAAPASAAPSYCSLGRACVWDDPDFNTNGSYAGVLWFEYYVTPMSSYNYAGTSVNAGNTADSWFNNGRYSVACFYDTATGGYGGSSVCLNTNQGDGNIENSSGIVQGLAWDPNAAKFV